MEGFLGLERWHIIFLLAPIIPYYVACFVFHNLDNVKALEKYRVQSKLQETRNKVDWQHALPWVVLQHILQFSAGVGMCYLEEYSEDFDPWYITIVKMGIGMVVMDTYQYWVHRWAHTNRWLFTTFHSWHHRLYCPYAIGALYNHPVEGFVLDAGSSATAILIAGMDLRAASIFVGVSTLKTVCDHANYYFWWNPLNSLFKNNAQYHDYHHLLRGFRFNYSQPYFTFWDEIMGTQHIASVEELNRPMKSGTKELDSNTAEIDRQAVEGKKAQ